MVSSVALLLLFVLLLVAVVSALLALRNRLAFRVALRNVRRGKVRTTLLILGLLVGTTIISGSLVINDTVTAVNQHFVLQTFGYSTEGIYNESAVGGLQPFPMSVFTSLNASLAGNTQFSGLAPEIVSVTQAYDQTRGIPETNLDLVGVNGNQSAALGAFTLDSGGQLSGPAAGQVLLDDQAAMQLGASAGDRLLLFGHSSTPLPVTVQGVVKDDTRGGFFFLFAGEAGNVFIGLSGAQTLANLSATSINFVAVTNSGPLLLGASNSDNASRVLNSTLAAIGAPSSLKVHELLKDGLAQAALQGQNTGTIFLVLGLFSIVAGGMLVVGIFVMLAEERMGEMGTMRAIGLRRGQLVLVFFFEGLAYAAGSALAGTLAGVAVGYGLTYAFSILLSSGTVSAAAILASFTVSTQSLLIAYVSGFLLTLLTVAIASWRASRLNIVQAIRSLPAPAPPIHLYTRLAYFGVPVTVVGLLVFLATYRGSSDVSIPSIGGDMVILGLAFIGSRFFRNQVVFTAAAIALLVWNGVGPLRDAILGNAHSGSIAVIFTLGIFLVLGAVLLFVFDSDYLVTALTRLASGSPRRAAVVKVGLTYPSRRPFRPAITLTIFTLVVFTVVVVAVFSDSLGTNLNNSIQAQSGGYSFYGTTNVPLSDIASAIRQNATLSPQFSAVVPLISGGAFLNSSHWSQIWWEFPELVHAAPVGLPDATDFYSTNAFTFASTQGGVSAVATWDLVKNNPNDVVLDGSYRPAGSSFVGGPHPSLDVGQTVEVRDAVSGKVAQLTVVGLLTGMLLPGIWLNPVEAQSLGYSDLTASLISVAPGASTVHAAQSLKGAFFAQGLVLLDFSQILAQGIQSFQAVTGLLEIFVALGLAVGIAAMGIVALRAVVERRREIGMLRAGGFRQSHIFTAFFLEYSYISLMGIFAGTVLALVLDYEAAGSGSNTLTFAVPWTTVGLVVVVAYVLTILAIVGPSIRAARLPPSEAVRYTE